MVKKEINYRLQRVERRSRECDIFSTSSLLMEKFNIDNRDIAYEMAKDINIRQKIDKLGIKKVIEETKKNITIKSIRLKQERCKNEIS